MSKSSEQNYLQPKFLYPLGARPLSTLNPSAFVLQALRNRSELSDSLPDSQIFAQFRQHPFIAKSLPAGSLRSIQLQWRGNNWPEFSPANNNISYDGDLSPTQYPPNSDDRENTNGFANSQLTPQEQVRDLGATPPRQEGQGQKPSRFEQHPGTQAPASIQRDIAAQNPTPSNSETPPNPQPISPNLQRYAQQLQQQNPQQLPPHLQKFITPDAPASEQPPVTPPRQEGQGQKPSRFEQHPGTQAPASIQRDIAAQNPTPPN
ncbi:MAG: hypothetical protein J7647_23750, partial [Cyanobacteria bacterium SBLK]|nr:hypothetical protein [Cyanobacteria bacterium SBLK]